MLVMLHFEDLSLKTPLTFYIYLESSRKQQNVPEEIESWKLKYLDFGNLDFEKICNQSI